jgi:hypothetical protein
MSIPKKKELTNDPEVRQEIERYKWIKFEMQGVNISFVRAAQEWLAHFSKAWLKVHVVAKKIMCKDGAPGKTNHKHVRDSAVTRSS